MFHAKRLSQAPAILSGISVALALAITTSVSAQSTGFTRTTAAPAISEVDKYRIVDCLLLGDVKRLGGITFLSPRRPVRVSVEDCQSRGGEYSLTQAGSAAAALSYWLPLAQSGDKAAQTTVGEMFEKGVGQTPDYAAAAQWYRRAADQGFPRAQINLGHLYEKGLGVAKDPVAALNLYRKAANIPTAIVLDDGSASSGRSEEFSRLTRELQETRRELEKARQELEKQRAAPEAEVAQLRQQLAAATNAGNSAEAKRLEVQVQQLDAQLLQHRRQVAMLQQSEMRYLEQMRALETEAGQLRSQVSAAATRDEELARLRRELVDARRDSDRLRREYEAERSLLQNDISRLREQQFEAASKGRADEARAFDEQMRQLQTKLAQREGQLGALEASTERYREQIRVLEGETAALKQQVTSLEGQLTAARGQLGAASRDLAERQREARDAEVRTAELRTELDRQKQMVANKTGERGRVAEIERTLRQRDEEKAKQAREIERLDRQVKQYQEQVTKLDAERRRVLAASPPPKIELIDPKITTQTTRGPIQVKVRGGLTSREVVGKVVAPAGLFSFKVNQLAEQLDDGGLFKVDVPLSRSSTPVNIIAIDRQGRQTIVELLMVPDSATIEASTSTGQAPASALVRNLLSPSDMGRYYALVIGNNNYPRLEKLDTAINDARALASILETKFGFQVTKLENATRVDTMRALSDMRKKLTSRDNLLIYYAGHGVYDAEKRRGFWQPVDAEPDNDANWINAIDITDNMEAIAAKHVLLIADSCYSGTLTRSSLTRLEAGKTEEQRVTYLKSIAKARVRVVLTSGSNEPVLDDSGDGKHSVFARYLLEVLRSAPDAIEASRVADAVKERVVAHAAQVKHVQRPTYQPISMAGHEGGDFVFMPVN